jgi:hypothetical protein
MVVFFTKDHELFFSNLLIPQSFDTPLFSRFECINTGKIPGMCHLKRFAIPKGEISRPKAGNFAVLICANSKNFPFQKGLLGWLYVVPRATLKLAILQKRNRILKLEIVRFE